MNEGLPLLKANTMFLGDADDDGIGIYLPEDYDNIFVTLPPVLPLLALWALSQHHWMRPFEAQLPRNWQAALDYEIGQLEKLGTWVIEDLPKGAPIILCTEVLKRKHRPTSVIESY